MPKYIEVLGHELAEEFSDTSLLISVAKHLRNHCAVKIGRLCLTKRVRCIFFPLLEHILGGDCLSFDLSYVPRIDVVINRFASIRCQRLMHIGLFVAKFLHKLVIKLHCR